MRPSDQAPLTIDVQDTLRRLWSSALNGAHVGPGLDFFDGGGDSLAAAELLAELRQFTGIALDAGWLYEHPRFADAAAALQSASRVPADAIQPLVRPCTPGTGHPLSSQQQGLLAVIERLDAAHSYQAAYAVALPARIDAARLQDGIAMLSERHTALRTTIRGRRQLTNQGQLRLDLVSAGRSAAREVAAK